MVVEQSLLDLMAIQMKCEYLSDLRFLSQGQRRYLAQSKRRRPRRCDTLRPLLPRCVGAGPDERDGAGGGVKV